MKAEGGGKGGGDVPWAGNLERNMETRVEVRFGRGENLGELAENVAPGL